MTEFRDRMDAEFDIILTMMDEGKSNKEIAATLGIHPSSLTCRLRNRGIKRGRDWRRKRIEAERGDEMIAMAKDGKTDKEIAAAVGVTPAVVPVMLHELGCETSSEVRVRRNAEMRKQRKDASKAREEEQKAALIHRAERMREMAEDGMSNAEIADEFGVCKGTVERWVKRAGLVRDQKWYHAQLVEKAEKDAEAAGATLLEEPRNHHAVVRYEECGHEVTIDYHMQLGLPSCPECKRIESEARREVEQREKEKRMAANAARFTRAGRGS